MTVFLSYVGWFLIGMLSIYLGACVRYFFFNKQKKSFRYFSRDYFYPNFIVGIYIFIVIFLVIRHLMGYEIINN